MSLQRFLGFLGLGATLGIASLVFGMNLVSDMKAVLKSTNDNVLAGEQNKEQILKKLTEFIELHAMAKELSELVLLINYKFYASDHLELYNFFIEECSSSRTHWSHLLRLFLCQASQPFAVQC